MRWILKGKHLSPAVAEALVRHQHTVVSLEQASLAADAPPDEFFAGCHKAQLDLLTDDPALADVPFQTPTRYDRSIVFLQVEGGDVEQDDAVDRLFDRYKRLTPGRLYTVTATRVKIRQLPGN